MSNKKRVLTATLSNSFVVKVQLYLHCGDVLSGEGLFSIADHHRCLADGPVSHYHTFHVIQVHIGLASSSDRSETRLAL